MIERSHAYLLGVLATVVAGAFGVLPPTASADSCPNAQFRVGPSADLPDCRAYELVTPADSEGVAMHGRMGADGFEPDVQLLSPSGDSVIFQVPGQVLPGAENTQDAPGQGDLYEAKRGSDGWVTSYVGVTVPEVSELGLGEGNFMAPYAASPDHRAFAFDSLPDTLRAPDGSLGLVGSGSLGTTDAKARWITAGAGHVIFETTGCGSPNCNVPLEPDAPPAGTGAIYDRPAGGPTRVVSLLPGDVTPAAGQSAFYEGASEDGSVVAFRIGGSDPSPGAYGAMYVRLDDATTQLVARQNTVRAGKTLTCTGGPASAALSYQWLRDGAPIAGATGPAYTTVSPSDEGKVIQCQVFATSANAGSTQVSRIVTDVGGFTTEGGVVVGPFPAVEPPTGGFIPLSADAPLTVGGAGGQTLTCNPGTWTGSPSFAYQWYRNGVAIPGATGDTYLTTATDVATAAGFQCAVTGTNAGGSATTVSRSLATSPAPSPAAPVATAVTGGLWVTFAGLSADGGQLFYLEGSAPQAGSSASGNLFDLDTASQTTEQLTRTGDITVVNVSADGSHVYFSSPSQLDGSKGDAGQPNLYVWDRATGAIRFIAVLDPADLALATDPVFGGPLPTLARWTPHPDTTDENNSAAGHADSALDASRTTPDGGVLVFESKARLTAYDNQRHTEVYRYAAADGSLVCVSCSPSGAPPSSDAHLESVAGGSAVIPTGAIAKIDNVTTDGQTVFFETGDALVPADTNGKQDVYEWHGGQVALISTGHSSFDSYLYGMTSDGSDVAFFTNEALVPQDLNSGGDVIYDARVDGGFPAPATAPGCVEDACQGAATGAPPVSTAASVTFTGPGDVSATAPSAKVRVLSRVVHGAAFFVRVHVPAKGRVTIAGASIRAVRRSLAKAGTYRLRVTLTAPAKRALKRKRSVRLRLRVRYAPASAPASTASFTLTVKPAVRHHAKRSRKPGRTARSIGGAR